MLSPMGHMAGLSWACPHLIPSQARRSETVLSVKKRALEQLDVWCRFTDVCNDGRLVQKIVFGEIQYV